MNNNHQWIWILSFSLLGCCVHSIVGKTPGAPFCTFAPGNTCFPTHQELLAFREQLNLKADLRLPGDELFPASMTMRTTLKNQIPSLIVYAVTSQDVQKTLEFAFNHNLRTVVRSSGHDYDGRSTAYGCLMLDVSRMNQITVLNQTTTTQSGVASALRCQSGASFGEIYNEAAKYDRVVVGGHDPTVAIGGLTLGGGHSAFSRQFGLAADQVLEMEVVLYNGTMIRCAPAHTASPKHTELCYALLGAGHSSYGVVTWFTIQTHPAPPAVTSLFYNCPMHTINGSEPANKLMKRFFFNLTWWEELPNTWSGWGSFSPAPFKLLDSRGSFGINLLYTGHHYHEDIKYIETLLSYPVPEATHLLVNYTTYASYSSANADKSNWYRSFISNIFVPHDQKALDGVREQIMTNYQNALYFVNMVFGGAISQFSGQNAVSEGFRGALLEVGPSAIWLDPGDDLVVAGIAKFAHDLYEYGPTSYVNEWTSYAGLNAMLDYKDRFYGGEENYQRLFHVDEIYDPCNFFFVNRGVGSERPHLWPCK